MKPTKLIKGLDRRLQLYQFQRAENNKIKCPIDHTGNLKVLPGHCIVLKKPDGMH